MELTINQKITLKQYCCKICGLNWSNLMWTNSYDIENCYNFLLMKLLL